MSEYTYNRSFLYPKQLEIISFEERGYRYSFVEASTKCGKSYSCLIWLFEKAISGNPHHQYWWVAPSYAQSTDMYRRTVNGLKESDLPDGSYVCNKSSLSVTLKNGATITFKSGDNFDSIMGADCRNCVIDEASLVPEEAWHNIQSTLTSTGGTCIAIGNINGTQNWFYKICRRAEIGDNSKWQYRKLTAYDAIEAGLYTEEDLEDFRASMSEARFNELYLCIPSENGFNPFGLSSIANCVVKEEDIEDRNVVVYGIDLAKSVDYSAVVGLNRKGEVVYTNRWRGNWIETEEKLKHIVANVPCLCDETGVGNPVIEHLRQEIPLIEGLTFTNKSKGEIIEGLAMAIQNREIVFPDSWLRNELDNFELEYTKTGKIRYEGRRGVHDDGVCALALAHAHFAETANTNQLEWSF